MTYICRPKTLRYQLGDEGQKNKLLRRFRVKRPGGLSTCFYNLEGKKTPDFQSGEVYTVPVVIGSTRKEVNFMKTLTAVVFGFTELQSEDKLSFMDVFTFPNLNKIRSDLKKAGYGKEKINEIISGLKTLPEYGCD